MHDRQQLKVVLINTSDTIGGAAVVTRRLMKALRNEGVDARMLVFRKTSDDEHVAQMKCHASFYAECAYVFAHNGFNRRNLFKMSAGHAGTDVSRHPWVRGADIIALNWINQGLLSLNGIERLARLQKPVIWTMHDMWPMTGGCHHAYECDRFRSRCGHCQYVKDAIADNDLSRAVWNRKHRLYRHSCIQFVPVSHWLADKCRESSLLGSQNIEVIPNAFPIDDFGTQVSDPSLLPSSIDTTKRLIVMGAARLDDPVKGFPYALEALNLLAERHPDIATRSQAVFFGAIRNPALLDELRFPHVHVGTIHSPAVLRQLYAAGSVVLSTSLYETLPGTLIEGQASGCVPVTFGRGGQGDIVDHQVNGYIARYRSAESIADGIRWALSAPVDCQFLHQHVAERFAAPIIARRYINLFNRLLDNKNTQ